MKGIFALFSMLFGSFLTTFSGVFAQVSSSGYAMDTYISDPSLWERFVSAAPQWLIALVPLLVAVLIACRGVSEILFLVMDKTQVEWDNKVYRVLVKTMEVLAKILGQVGVGMPKRMVMEKAEKEAAKELNSG